MNKTKLALTLAAVPVVAGAFLASAVLSPAFASKDCNIDVDLQGTVTKNEASVTNHSKNDACVYDATLAVYESPQEPETHGWIEAQKLIGSKTVSVKAGETVKLKVDGKGSSCWYQADLIRGKKVLTPPVYRTAIDVDVYKIDGECKVVESKNLAQTGNSFGVLGFLAAGAVALFAGLRLRKSKSGK